MIRWDSCHRLFPALAAFFRSAALGRILRRVLRCLDLDSAARTEEKLSIGDDPLARLDTFFDNRLAVKRPADDNRADFHPRFAAYDEYLLALLARLHSLRRDDDRALIDQLQHRFDELPRPQAAVAVGERSLELDGSRRTVNGVVDEGQIALLGALLVFGSHRLDIQPAGGKTTFHFGQILLGNRERYIDRADLIDRHERRGIVGADDVALVHQQTARPPRNR